MRIELDASEIHPMRPGDGTPMMVFCRGNWGTLACALGEHDVDGEPLSDSEVEWLCEKERFCDEWMDWHFAMHPDYAAWRKAFA